MKSPKSIFSSKAAKVSRALLLSGVAAVAISGCATYNPNVPNYAPNWQSQAYQSQMDAYNERARYAKEGRDLQRKYLLREYRSCKTELILEQKSSMVCQDIMYRVERGHGR